MSFSFQGIIPAVWTPTDANGALVKEALRSNIAFIQKANVSAAMEARGLHTGAPKQVVSTATRARFERLRENFRELFSELNLQTA